MITSKLYRRFQTSLLFVLGLIILSGCQSSQLITKDIVGSDSSVTFEFRRFVHIASMEVHSDGTCILEYGATSVNHTHKSLSIRAGTIRLLAMGLDKAHAKELRNEFKRVRYPTFDGQPYCKMIYKSQYGDPVIVKLYTDVPLQWANEVYQQAMIKETGNLNFSGELGAKLYTPETDIFGD